MIRDIKQVENYHIHLQVQEIIIYNLFKGINSMIKKICENHWKLLVFVNSERQGMM